MDEALADLIEKRKRAKPRAHVMGAYLASHEKDGPLYKKLAERLHYRTLPNQLYLTGPLLLR